MIRIRHMLPACVIALAACTQYSLVDGKKPVTMANTFTVAPQIDWSKTETAPLETWTVEGPLLHEVVFVKGVKHGQALQAAAQGNDDDRPTFDKDMTSLEIRDLVVATLTLTNQHRIDTTDLRPWKFGGANGFRFEFTMVTDSGLQKKGFAAGAVRDEKLYLIFSSAAAIHYFDEYADTIEELVASVEFI